MPHHPTAPRPVPGDASRTPPVPEPRPDPRAGHPGAPPFPRPPVPPGPPGGINPGGPFPPPRPPAPGGPTGSTEGGTVRVETEQAPAAPAKTDLSLNKVLAGAGAAATTAVLGSFFGAEGTVVGAAFGSVASTMATTLYQRSLDRTRDTLVAVVRVRRGSGGQSGQSDQSDSEMTVRLPPVDADGSVRPDLGERPAPRRRWLLWAGLTALVFAVAMAVITGIELAKGSTITGNESGTSIGRAADPRPAAPVEDEEGSGSEDADTTTTPEPTADPESSATATPDPDAPGGAEGDSETQQDEEQAPEDDPGGSVDVRPTERDTPGETRSTPESGARSGTGTNPGGGAAPGVSNRFGSAAVDRFRDGHVPATTTPPPTSRP